MIVNNIKKNVNGVNVLNDISFSLSSNSKVALCGVNGAGKSTLLKILSGIETMDSGSINLGEEKVSYLKQEIPSNYNNYTILDYIKEEIGIDKLETRLHELENNITDDNMEEYGNVLNEYIYLDGYSFEDNLKMILSGLNFKRDLDSLIKTLSGGEKIKVLLAIVLLENKEILLLDEPTNNLDIDAIEWLEKKLKESNKKMIIVSHDETFLNNVVDKIFELNNGYITEYNMKYNDYLFQKDLEYQQEKEGYIKALEQKDKLKKQLQKAKEWSNKGNNSKAFNDNDKLANNYAKERTKSNNISKISKEIDNLYVPHFEEKKPINVFFDFSKSKGNKDIILENLICGYEQFHTPEINLIIPFGTKVNILGENGSGKTTLINTILGKVNPISGNIKIGNDVRIGYISQNTLEEDSNDTIYSYLIKGNTSLDKSFIFTLLKKFNISYDDKDKLYNLLSPGERTRVNLVKLAIDNINVIVLDEVTNHLDKEALELIYELVKDYQGSIISVSHNRKYNDILSADINYDIKTGSIVEKTLSKKL